MKLTVIGCTGSMSGPNAAASSYLIQESDGRGGIWSVVCDMGPGSFGNLWRVLGVCGFDINRGHVLDAVMFSHWHADHCSDLLSYQIFRRWHPKVKMPVQHVYSPGGGLQRVRQLDGFAGEDGFPEFAFHDFDVPHSNGQDIVAGTPIVIGPMSITPYSAYHAVPAVSLRFQSLVTGKVITYSGDTDYCPGVVEAARDADIFLADCGFTDDDTAQGIHMSGTRAGRVAREAGVKMLVPTHIQPWTDPDIPVAEAQRQFDGEIRLAFQDMEIEI